jgi:hypothetical protein
MKIVYGILGAFLALIVAFGVVEKLASERIEVVELHTNDETGQEVTTRLWIVDHEGYPYLRTGDDQSGWFTRLKAQDEIKLTRKDSRQTYQTTQIPGLRDRINTLMQDKYTWGDTFIGYVFGRDDAIPIRLVLVQQESSAT